MTPFTDRANEMGLNVDYAFKGLYTYTDQYSEIVYRTLAPLDGNTPHPTDNIRVPKIALFTRPLGKNDEEYEYRYCGLVSDIYRFIGNDVLVERIRQSITSIGMPILEENPIMNFQLTSLRNEMIIQSSKNVPNVGDVLPVMIVDNSYDGTKAASVSFGITTNYRQRRLTFAFSLGKLRQVHVETSNTSVTSAIESYMEVFSEDIVDVIQQSFTTTLTENQMLGTLDVIEGLGKKRRDAVSTILAEMMPEVPEGQPKPLPSAWQVFLAIVRYSSFEENLNMKRLLENAAESVLVIPARMYDVLEKIGE